MSTPGTKILYHLSIIPQQKDSVLLGKEVDSKAGAGKIQDEPEISFDIRKDICAKRYEHVKMTQEPT